MSHPRRTRLVVLIVTVVALGIPAGVAFAYWTSGAAGAGAGNTGTLSALSLTPGSPSADIYPGAQADVVLTASNPNTDVAHIGSLVLDTAQGTGGFAVDGVHAGCSVATLGYITQTNGGAGWNVPARVGMVDGTLAITLNQALTMGVGAASACQGATFIVYLRAA